MIKVSGLGARYTKKFALKDIDLSVEKGERVALLGPDGGGKSTLFKCMLGLLLPAEGEVLIEGRNLLRESLAIRGRVGYLAQDNPIYPKMSVYQQLGFMARLRDIKNTDAAIGRVGERCGLMSHMARPLEELEPATRRRFGLAQALLGDPPILFIDEPTRDLTSDASAAIQGILDAVENATLVVSTNELDEARRLSDRFVVIHNSKAVLKGSPESIIKEEEAIVRVIVEIAAEERRVVSEALEGLSAVKSMEMSPTEGADTHGFEIQGKPDGNLEEQIKKAVDANEEWELKEYRNHQLDLASIYKRAIGG